MKKLFTLLTILSLSILSTHAAVWVPNVFSSHMVLQRNHKNPVWGKADASEKITVTINGKSVHTQANKDGKWRVYLEEMPAGGPHTLTVQGQSQTLTFDDVLVGEVWVCAGQSNMGWAVSNANHAALEIAAANYDKIRLLKPAQVTAETPLDNIETTWMECTSEHIKSFSATGYFFGRRLYQVLHVPIGLIDVSWGSSNAETWMSREVLEENDDFKELLDDWDDALANFTDETLANYTKKYEAWVAQGKPGKKMTQPRDIRTSQNRPANGYNGMISPIIGYGIQGTIWCQGEGNIGRSYQHRRMFPKLITSWRAAWQQGDFPFYWVQLAGKTPKVDTPQESFWAEFRESQTMTLALPNTGEVITQDLGLANNIHFGDKQTVANRLVLHALRNQYGYKMACESPRYESMKITGNKITITFSHVDSGLYAHDVNEVHGFAVAGKDKKYVFGKAKIVGKNKVIVTAEGVDKPVAVRYGWANNPRVNLYDKNGLPVTGFRTDDWPGKSFGKEKAIRRSGS